MKTRLRKEVNKQTTRTSRINSRSIKRTKKQNKTHTKKVGYIAGLVLWKPTQTKNVH